MKHAKHFLLTVAIWLCSLTAGAQVDINGIYYNLDSETKQAEVTRSTENEYSGSIVIPPTVTYDGTEYCVTSIGESAFSRCGNISSVTLSNTTIGEAFTLY